MSEGKVHRILNGESSNAEPFSGIEIITDSYPTCGKVMIFIECKGRLSFRSCLSVHGELEGGMVGISCARFLPVTNLMSFPRIGYPWYKVLSRWLGYTGLGGKVSGEGRVSGDGVLGNRVYLGVGVSGEGRVSGGRVSGG